MDDDQQSNCTYSLLFRLCDGGTSMFHHLPCLLPVSNAKKMFSSGLGSKKSSRLMFINWALSCSPVWHLGHYSNVFFNLKSNVIVTLSEHIDGNFQARCDQRLQSTKSRRPEGNNITMYVAN
jgi:hypothetical protein